MAEISEIIGHFFTGETPYKPSKKAAFKIAEHFFTETEEYNKSHKKLILSNLGFLARNTKIPKNQEEAEAFLKEIQSKLQTKSLSLDLPDAAETNPFIKAMYEKMMTGSYDFKALLHPSLLKAVFKKNPELLKEARSFFESVLIQIGEQAPELDEEEAPLVQTLVGNLLAFVTYFDPQDGEQIQVPQYVNGKWQTFTYTIDRIELTPRALGSPMVAFGLRSDDESAPPLLLFKGTTYPADDGFALSFFSDINIGAAVGGYAFKFGKGPIEKWLKEHTQNVNARVYGQSLGGSLTLHTVANFPEYIEQAEAFSPTALHSCNLRKWKRLAKSDITLPKVNVFCPENDLVPLAGLKWRKEWNVYRIFAKKKYDFLYAHTQIFFSQKKFMLVKVDPKKDQRKPSRIFVAITHMILSVPMFLIGIQFYAIYLLIVKIKDCIKRLASKNSS